MQSRSHRIHQHCSNDHISYIQSPCFTKYTHQPGHKHDTTGWHKHGHHTRSVPAAAETTTRRAHGPPSSWTCQLHPLGCSPLWCGMQSLLPQHRLRGLSQWGDNPLRVEGPLKLTMAHQDNWHWLDHWPKNQRQEHHLWNSSHPISNGSKQFICMQQHISTHQLLPCNLKLPGHFHAGKGNRQRLPERFCQPHIAPSLTAHEGQWQNWKRPHGIMLSR